MKSKYSILLASAIFAISVFSNAEARADDTPAPNQIDSQQLILAISDAGNIGDGIASDANVDVSITEDATGLKVASKSQNPLGATAESSLKVTYASGESIKVSGNVSTFDTSHSEVSGAVISNANGFSIYTVIDSVDAPDFYTYKLSVPPGTEISPFLGGYSLDGENYSAVITAPWAVDANGKQVHTFFSLDGDMLTQHLDLGDESIAFPVVADPNWTYPFRKQLVNVNTTQAWLEMQNKFDYFFPVEGAPHLFPTPGQILPLKVAPLFVLAGTPLEWNFECTMGPIDNHNGLYGWYFYATKNHIDGYGSWIRFRLMNSSSGPLLAVDAFIVNDFLLAPFGVLNDYYETEAKKNWSLFAYRLDLN